MIRDLMLACVERRFAALRAPHPVQWLADNGSAYTAHDTREIAVALNLVICFTPVRSPESNGVSEAFVKKLKRDYARIHPRALRCYRSATAPDLDRRLQRGPPPQGLADALTQ